MAVVPCLLTPSLQGEVNAPMAENWCCAQAKVVELLYTRTINHTKCSTFSVRSNSDLKGSLKVNANRLDVDNKNNLPLYLLLVSREDSEFFFKLDSSSNVSREEAKITNSHGAFHFLPEKNSSFEKLIGTCIVLDKASELLPDDKLTIYFEVNVLENANLSEPSSVVRFKVPECRLSNDHRNLSEGHPLSERQSTMFEYETEEKRLVSSNKSEFHAMLKCSILNANREEIEIVESHETKGNSRLKRVFAK
ncbi:protein roadkill [Rhipicephalus sanguineus]|uniref:Uncharacterized protein n=1 Tax=Rhipicephalus sanguineus TaxID=34632 RepID=A0A9D4QDJ5_RHISA|nr:protein roadkill [Rhipicephalus sanguineus]KAH7976430.1 hypothetical protein HPB52_013837 [Rhipicephalus sanguineus]